MDGGGRVVCVTGASGYIASWVVKILLTRGYTVKATVRNPNDGKKTEHLLALDGAKEKLQLFKADLSDEGSFDSIIKGCDGVFHTASPVLMSVDDPHAELIDPAVKGTLNVLKSCKKSSSVKRVVLTSSTAAVLCKPKLGPDDNVDETYFSDPTFCENLKAWYALSKTLAEDAAWKFVKENGIDMVTINPGLVIGPILQPSVNVSVEVVVDLINGKNPYNSKGYRFIDVRDVAVAHVKAFEVSSANGRYIIDSSIYPLEHIEKVFHEFYPNLRLTDKNEEKEVFQMYYNVIVEKVKSLGIEFTPMEVSLRDTVMSLKEKGLLCDPNESCSCN